MNYKKQHILIIKFYQLFQAMQAIIRKELRHLVPLFSIPMFFSFSLLKSQQPSKPYHKGNMKADLILKNYFRNRSQMSNIGMVELFDTLKNVKVGTAFFNDHRWIHLNVLIQKNLINFSITEQFKLLQALTRLKHYNELFNSLFVNLLGKLNTLQPNQKAALFYFKAKRGKTNPELVKTMSDSLLQSLKSKSLKITYPLLTKKLAKEQEGDDEEEEQQLFPDTSFGQVEEISCRNLILCFWSLQKMRIKDSLLSDCILKELLRPRIKQLPASLFPLFLSALWLHGMEKKRIYNEITFQLKTRSKELNNLDRDKIKMLICMLCKPDISQPTVNKQELTENPDKQEEKRKLVETRKNLVLWLMQTLMLKHEAQTQYIFSTTAYQILTNASEAKIIDTELYQKYLSIICTDLSKIQTKQVIYLLSIIQRLSIYWQRKNKANNLSILCLQEHKILSEHLRRNMFGFLQKFDEGHPARTLLRKMTLANFIEIPKTFKKKIAYQQKTIRRKNSFSSRGDQKSEERIKTNKKDQPKEERSQRTRSKKRQNKFSKNEASSP